MLLFEYTILRVAQKNPKHAFPSKVATTIINNCLLKGYVIKNSNDDWELTHKGLADLNKIQEQHDSIALSEAQMIQ